MTDWYGLVSSQAIKNKVYHFAKGMMMVIDPQVFVATCPVPPVYDDYDYEEQNDD